MIGLGLGSETFLVKKSDMKIATMGLGCVMRGKVLVCTLCCPKMSKSKSAIEEVDITLIYSQEDIHMFALSYFTWNLTEILA